MSKPVRVISIILLAFSIFLSCQSSQAEEITAESAEDLEGKFEINRAFLEAAGQIVEESGSSEAISYVKKAASVAEEARMHRNAGDLEFALEDLAESNRFATYAIIFSTGADGALRATVLKQELRLRAEEEHKRKEERIKKGILEVEIFIKTGERLLSEGDHPGAREKLKEAKKIFASSKEAVASGNYDKALSDIKAAYTLATGSIKDIKHSRNEIITFPRPDPDDEKELFVHELRRNDTYLVVASGLAEDKGLVRQAVKLRDEAVGESASGNYQQAIEKLKASTGLLIETIKTSE